LRPDHLRQFVGKGFPVHPVPLVIHDFRRRPTDCIVARRLFPKCKKSLMLANTDNLLGFSSVLMFISFDMRACFADHRA
jgi:hypothetical protein